MNLTKKKAMDLTIELWEFLAETGMGKEDWDGWERFGGLDGWDECDKVESLCFLCEYTRQDEDCARCPYCKRFGRCGVRNAPYNRWYGTQRASTKKKYANLFLKQLYELRDEQTK